jgi:filamentous hemagglutinin family protein
MTAVGSRVSTSWRLSAITVALACVFAAEEVQANGTNPTVVAGQASFSTQGSTLSITNSPGTIVNWQGFSIGPGEATRIIQQNAASSILNRVIGPDPSAILGTLISNGRVFLINPSGILVGQGAHIDVAGLVASTLNLSNQDFLAGRLNFISNPLAGRVENQGSITTPSGGSVYLVGANVSNSGIINSPQGDVILAAGQSVKIFDSSTPGVRVELTASDNTAVNLGEILAQSGQVGIYGAALRNSGVINADQVVRDAGGKIVLRAKQDVTLDAASRLSANGGQGGTITVQSDAGTTLASGTIEAKGATGTGGTVQLLGNRVGLIGASVDASGTTGGGTVLVGGDFQGKNPSVQNAQATYVSSDTSIKADAITSGNGGKVIVWSDDFTGFHGNISARGGVQGGDGGFTEVSGKNNLVFDGYVDLRASNGNAGTLLLDPNNIIIAGSGPDVAGNSTGLDLNAAINAPNIFFADYGVLNSTITTGQVVTQLNTANVTLQANNDITVAAAIDAHLNAVGKALTLQAGHDVIVNAALTASNAGGGSFNLNAGNNVTVGAAITASGGSVTLSAGNNGTGPGVAGGTVTFSAVTAANLAIRFNPANYSTTSAEIAAYAPKATLTGTFDARAWTFINNASATAQSKPYDGLTAATLNTPFTFKSGPDGVTAGQIVTLSAGSANFNSAHVASATTVNFTGYGFSAGGDSANYALFAQPASQLQTITPKALTAVASITGAPKTYDGLLAASGSTVGGSITSGLVGTDSMLLNTGGISLNFSDAHVVTAGKTISATGSVALGALTSSGSGTKTGSSAGNEVVSTASDYALAAQPVIASVAGTITAKTLSSTATITPVAKVYDGLLAASTSTIAGSTSGTINGDTAVLDTAGMILTNNTAHAGATTIAATGSSALGAFVGTGVGAKDGTAGNQVAGLSTDYTLTQPTITNQNVAGTITAKTLSSTATITPVAKVYDGLLAASTSTIAGSTSGTINGDTAVLDTAGMILTNNTAHAGATTIAATGSSALGAFVGTGVGAKDGTAGNQVAGLSTDYTLTQPTITNQNVAGTINAKALAVAASITGAPKTYDGLLAASGSTVGGSITSGLVGADSMLLNTSGISLNFSDAHVATAGKTIGATGSVALGALTSSGSGTTTGSSAGNEVVSTASDYVLAAQPVIASVAGTINAKALVPSLANSGVTKTYDGTTAAPAGFTPTYSFSGLAAGDTAATLAHTGAVYDFANVIAASKVTVSGLAISAISGTNSSVASDYALDTTSKFVVANITPASVSFTGTRLYDGTLNFAANTFGTAGTITTGIGTENLLLSGTGTVASKDVVSGSQAVNTAGLTLNNGTGTASNYTFTGGTHTGQVTAAGLLLSGTQVYNGLTAYAGTNLTARGVAGETFAIAGAGAAGNLASKNVQSNSALATLNGLSLGASGNGGVSSNYNALTTTGSSVNVTARPVTLTAPSVTKNYDGQLGYATSPGDLNLIMLSGPLVGSDTVSAATIAYTNKNAGAGNKAVNLNAATINDGNGGANYIVILAGNTTSTITQAALAINAVTDSRVYNGTASSAGVVTYTGLQTGDTLTGLSQAYTSKNVLGANLSTLNVNGGYTLTDGNAGGNYSVTTNGAAGTITALGITGSITAANKVYDANSSATILTRTLSGAIVGDTVSYSGGTALFSDKNAATGKTVTGTGLSLIGADAGNYTVNTTATTTASITPAPLGIAANSSSKIYGSTKSFSGTEFSSTGLKNGETIGSVSLASAGAVATAGVAGSPYAITASNAAGGSFSAGNYSISYVDGALGVTRAPLGIAANSATRLYGDANPAFSASYTGFQNGETTAALTGALALTTPAVPSSGVGSYAITPSGQSSANYAISYVNGALGVTPAPLGIAANSTSKIYGSTKSFSGTEFSSTGLKNGETVGSVSLVSAGAPATAGVAGSPYVITAGNAAGGSFSAGNYSISYVNGALGVTPAPLGIAANSATRLYGDANPAFSASYTGFQNGETTAALTGALALATPAVLTSGVGNYAITPSGQSSANYAISYVNGALGVTPAPLGIAANSSSKIYGSTKSFAGTEFISTGLKNGETVGSVSLASTGAPATAGVAGSPYAITAGNAAGGSFSAGNYSISYVDGALGVTPAPLGIAANSATRLYGDANPAFSASYTGFQNGETTAALTGALALVTPAVPSSGVGSYAITPSGQSSANYAISYVNGALGVTPAPLGIAANSSSKIYGSTVNFAGSEFSSTGLKNGETIGSVSLASTGAPATAGVAGSPYAITAGNAAGGSFSAGNYSISYVDGALGVTPAPLGIAANSATRLYGDANPAFSASYTGFQNGETTAALTGALALVTPAVLTSGVGNYAITPSGQSSANYAISYVNGALGVTPAPLGIAANSSSKIYGSTKSFSGTEFSSTGLKNGETIGSVSLASTGAVATAGVAGSPYAITASNAAGGSFSAGNYSISYVDGALGVTPAPLGIAANSATRLYGDANPAFSASYTGFQNGETAAALTGALALVTPAVPISGVGNYAITPSGQSSANYAISYVNGVLGVTPVSLVVTADAKSKVYGTSDPALTFTATGLVNNPALGVVDTAAAAFSGALTRAPGETVAGGPYAIAQGTLATNSNYTLSSFTANALTVTPAVLSAYANPQRKVYGTSDPALTFTATGLVNNPSLGVTDTAATVFSGVPTRAPGETVTGGPYAIAQGTLVADSNYTLGFTGNALTVTPAALHVIANPQSKIFGTSDPALTFGVAGLVNNPALGINDTAATVLSGALTRAPGESALGGPYAITQGSLLANGNYTLGYTRNNLIITGVAVAPVLGFDPGQVIFTGIINNDYYHRPGNFWHISLNFNNADPGFDVMRGTSDVSSSSIRRRNSCGSVFGGGFCETWSFPQQFEKVDK